MNCASHGAILVESWREALKEFVLRASSTLTLFYPANKEILGIRLVFPAKGVDGLPSGVMACLRGEKAKGVCYQIANSCSKSFRLAGIAADVKRITA